MCKQSNQLLRVIIALFNNDGCIFIQLLKGGHPTSRQLC